MGQGPWLAVALYLFVGPLATLLWAAALAILDGRVPVLHRAPARTSSHPTDLSRRMRRV
jgi:hypothetical protein